MTSAQINTAINHQPALVAVAREWGHTELCCVLTDTTERGALDDAVYFRASTGVSTAVYYVAR